MTNTEANQKWLELHALAGDRMLEQYNQDYLNWLNDEEIKIACEVEKAKFGNEFCICGSHDDPDFTNEK